MEEKYQEKIQKDYEAQVIKDQNQRRENPEERRLSDYQILARDYMVGDDFCC
jgi:hypothetical protein